MRKPKKNDDGRVLTTQFIGDLAKKTNLSHAMTASVFSAMKDLIKKYVDEGRNVELSGFLHLERKDKPGTIEYFNFYTNQREIRSTEKVPYSYKVRLSPKIKYPSKKK